MTPASDTRPVRRLVEDHAGNRYVVEVFARYLRIRPYRARRPAQISETWSAIYYRAWLAEVDQRRRERARGRRKRVRR